MFGSRRKSITELYNKLLEREPDPVGLDNFYNSKMDLEQIRGVITSSEEYRQLQLSAQAESKFAVRNTRKLSKSLSQKFYDIDDEETYLSAKKKYGDQWVWSNQDFSYNINSHGYRMPEFSDINWSNYIAVFGCSFTVGVGLPQNLLFSTKISQELNLDLVNLAQPGASNDLIVANVVRLFAHRPLPKLVIVNWTALGRRSFWVNGKMEFYGVGLETSGLWEDSHREYSENKEQWPQMFYELKQQVDVMCKLSSVPCWHITNFAGYDFTEDVDKIYYNLDDVAENINNIEYVNSHLARDVHLEGKYAHPGKDLQDRILERWKQIKGSKWKI